MNKKMFVVGMLVASMSLSVFAIGMVGPPTAETRQGQFGFNLGYSYTREDLKNQSFKGSDTSVGSWADYRWYNFAADPLVDPADLRRILESSGTWFENNRTEHVFQTSGLELVGFDVDDNPIYQRFVGFDAAADFDPVYLEVLPDGTLAALDPAIDLVGEDPDTRVYSTSKMKFDKLRTSRYFGTFSYGLTDDWEVSATLGFATVKTGGAFGDELWDVSVDPSQLDRSGGQRYVFDDSSPYFGFGTKYTFYRQDNMSWGASFNMNWLKAEGNWKETRSSSTPVAADGAFDRDSEAYSGKYTVKYYEMMFAVGPTIDMGGWKLYGGPFYRYLSGDIKISDNGSDTWSRSNGVADGDTENEGSGNNARRLSADLKARNNFGGFVGAQIPLGGNSNLGVEFASTGNGYGLSTSIGFAF